MVEYKSQIVAVIQQKIKKYYLYQFALSISQYMFLPTTCINAC